MTPAEIEAWLAVAKGLGALVRELGFAGIAIVLGVFNVAQWRAARAKDARLFMFFDAVNGGTNKGGEKPALPPADGGKP